MSAPRMTKRRLLAIDMALSAMLAGIEGEGDWDPDVSLRDLEDALPSNWRSAKIR